MDLEYGTHTYSYPNGGMILGFFQTKNLGKHSKSNFWKFKLAFASVEGLKREERTKSKTSERGGILNGGTHIQENLMIKGNKSRLTWENKLISN